LTVSVVATTIRPSRRRYELSRDVILAHDFGTTGNKAVLFDAEGNRLASHYSPYETTYPQAGWAEQKPDDWKHAFRQSTRSVLSSARVRPKQIAAVSFSGHMLGCVPVDAQGNVLRKTVFLWADCRSQQQAEFINETIGWDTFYRTTGGGLELALYPAAKILWLKEHEPEVYAETYKFIGTKDLLVHWLTGSFATDYSDASNTGLFDIRRRVWADELVRALGLDMKKLPEEVLPSTKVVGQVTPQAARETGLAEGIPVVMGGGDVPCAAVGAGVVKEGTIYNYIGSASWVAMATQRPIFDNKMRPFTLCHLVPDMYVSQLATYSAGVVYGWFRDQICQLEAARAEETNQIAFDLMDQEAACSQPGARGLLFLPHLRPGGAPFHDLDARGALFGLTLAHTRADVIRAVLEGITINIRLVCEALERQAGSPFSQIRMVGGGAKSRLWRDIAASVLNKEVLSLSAQQEANSLGAAIIACIGIGIFDQFDDAAQRFIRVEETTLPDKNAQVVYDALFQLFQTAYKHASNVHGLLKRLSEPQRE